MTITKDKATPLPCICGGDECQRDKLRAQVAELRAALEDILSLVNPIDTEEDVLYTTATGVLARTAPAEGRER